MSMQPKKRWHLWAALFSIAFAAGVAAVGLFFDRFASHHGESPHELLYASNILTGVVAGVAVFLWVHYQERGRRIRVSHLHSISELNHHVRNALQIISYFMHEPRTQENAKFMRDSVQRIDWALREMVEEYLQQHGDEQQKEIQREIGA
jgi:hypothetical protein